jgi:hypothetical protein
MPHFSQVSATLAAVRPPGPANQYSPLLFVWFAVQALVLVVVAYLVVRFAGKVIRRSRERST